MVQLVLYVCLLSEPDTCKTVRLSYFEAERATPYQCLIEGQGEAIKWLEGNPKWYMKKQSCERAGTVAGI